MFTSFLAFSPTLNRFWTVVYCIHVHCHAGLGFPRIHGLLPLPTAERQTPTFHVSRDRNRRILFHFRRGRVRIFLTLSAYRLSSLSSDARRIWFWRYSPVIFTGFVCFFAGGIVSEIVQSMLPVCPLPPIFGPSRLILTPQYKEFQIWDVVANLLGSSVGLYIAYHLEKYYRHRREVRDRSLDLTRAAN